MLENLEYILTNWLNLELFRSWNSPLCISTQQKFENLLATIHTEGFFSPELIMPSVTDVEKSLMQFQNFKEKIPLSNAIIQEYYRLFFEELSVMKRNKQKEDKDCSTKIVTYS